MRHETPALLIESEDLKAPQPSEPVLRIIRRWLRGDLPRVRFERPLGTWN